MSREDKMIPVLAMNRDPRLRHLFALAGRALYSGMADEDALIEVLMQVAPEYVPPDEPENMPEWEQLCADAEAT